MCSTNKGDTVREREGETESEIVSVNEIPRLSEHLIFELGWSSRAQDFRLMHFMNAENAFTGIDSWLYVAILNI